MRSRHLKATMKAEEEIAQVAGTLAGADNARSRQIWLGLVEKKKLDLSMHLITSNPDRRWNLDLIRLYSDVVKNIALLIPRSTNKLTGDRKVTAELTNCGR